MSKQVCVISTRVGTSCLCGKRGGTHLEVVHPSQLWNKSMAELHFFLSLCALHAGMLFFPRKLTGPRCGVPTATQITELHLSSSLGAIARWVGSSMATPPVLAGKYEVQDNTLATALPRTNGENSRWTSTARWLPRSASKPAQMRKVLCHAR